MNEELFDDFVSSVEQAGATRELEILAASVHGALAALHALGAIYNARNRNWRWAAFHAAAAVLDTYAVVRHHRAAKEAH